MHGRRVRISTIGERLPHTGNAIWPHLCNVHYYPLPMKLIFLSIDCPGELGSEQPMDMILLSFLVWEHWTLFLHFIPYCKRVWIDGSWDSLYLTYIYWVCTLRDEKFILGLYVNLAFYWTDWIRFFFPSGDLSFDIITSGLLFGWLETPRCSGANGTATGKGLLFWWPFKLFGLFNVTPLNMWW